ncbi:hypothetical protein RhiirC2_841237 [Rhizophagus irregularis]|uniref:Uncharacterized protein n=1 Tax=Rhizophagus irregularis TaxID=588596 RepID=A0A2N1P4G5_9GLOM|nr:hypothetical protein RhiirC2_841237 [Rhizophagus irregularis]
MSDKEEQGNIIRKNAMKYYGYLEAFIALFGILSMLYYTVTVKSDIEMMNGELKDRIDTVKGMVNLVDSKIGLLDNKIELLGFKFDVIYTRKEN